MIDCRVSRAGVFACTVVTASMIEAAPCDRVPDMFCVSQRVVSHWRDGSTDEAARMFVYRFRGGSSVEIAHGNPPVTKKEELVCVEDRTYMGLMVFAFSADWRQGVATFVDPGMSTVEFLNCAVDD